MMSVTFAAVICDADNPCSVNLRKSLNRLLQYHHEIQLNLYIFNTLPLIQHFSNDIYPLVRRSELFHPSSLLHRSPLSYF